MLVTWASADPATHFFRIFGGVIAGIGAVFLLIGVGMVVGGRRVRRRGTPATATILGYRRTRRTVGVGGGFRVGDAPPDLSVPQSGLGPGAPPGPGLTGPGFADSLYPIVEFQTSDGQTVRTLARNGSNPRRGKVGAQVTVRYDERHPDRVWADTGGRLMVGFVELVLSGLGLLFLVVGLEILRAN